MKRMPEERVRIIAYSGYRGEETPKEIVLPDKTIEVVEILSRWIEQGVEGGAIRRFFEVRGGDGSDHKLLYDEKKLEWFLVKSRRK